MNKYRLDLLRRDYINSLSFFIRLLVWTGIIKIWFEPRKNNKLPPMRCECLNVMNPLTYLWLIIAFALHIASGIITGIDNYVVDLKNAFKVSKWG